jgi:hypothetical protein
MLSGMSQLPPDEALRRWKGDRRREVLKFMWEWDPLGIMGVAESEYEALAATAVNLLLMEKRSRETLADALREEVLRLASEEGYSRAAAERNTVPAALTQVVARLSTWWATVPPPPGAVP